MHPIIDIIDEIRRRPGVYLRNYSVKNLAAFLEGYSCAAEKCGAIPNGQFLLDFGDWVRRRFRVELSQSWENILLFHSVDEREAMQCFWQIWDEYLTEIGMSEVNRRHSVDGGDAKA